MSKGSEKIEERMTTAMIEWNVSAQAAAPAGKKADVAPSSMDKFLDYLARFDGAVSADTLGWGVLITVKAPSAEEAFTFGTAQISKAAKMAKMPKWPLLGVEVLRTDEHDRRLEIPNFPEVLGTTEVTELLGVTRQRLHQLRSAGRFPAPMIELAATPLWLKTTIDSFLETWDRSGGRPRALWKLIIEEIECPGEIDAMVAKKAPDQPNFVTIGFDSEGVRSSTTRYVRFDVAEQVAKGLGLSRGVVDEDFFHWDRSPST
jgi:hypothetical protein